MFYRKAVVAMFKNSTQHRQELATQNTGKPKLINPFVNTIKLYAF